MEWVDVKEELPEKKNGLYAIRYRAIDEIKPKNFSMGYKASYNICWAYWSYEENKVIESTNDKIIYAKEWGFKTGYMESNFINNVTHWMPLPKPPEEKK